MKNYMCCHICRRHAGAIRGVQLENNRRPEDPYHFPISDIDRERTKENVSLVRSDDWMGDIKQTLKNHGILSYRKDAVLLLDTVYSASKSFFMVNNRDTAMDYFQDCLRVHTTEFGPALNAIIHFDEWTPHMHVVSVPIVKRENGYALCAKELVGGKARLYMFHDRLYLEIGQNYDLERGIRSDSFSKKEHLDTYRYKLFCLEEKISIAYNDLERIKVDVDRYGNMKELFAWASDIASKVDSVVAVLGTVYTTEKIQEDIEARGILLEKRITEAGCNIQKAEDERYCFITDSNGAAVSWDEKIPLYVQDGGRLIPSAWALEGKLTIPWRDTDIIESKRDSVECSPVERLDQIADELDNLIDAIDHNDDAENKTDNVDIQEDD